MDEPNQYYNYLTVGADDVNWGLFLTVAGFSEFDSYSEYPPQEHPSAYNFTWNSGRILDEYQLLYISKGRGVYENKNQTIPIKAGHIMFLFPGQWHRYRPDKKTGWKEYYIGFKGEIADRIFNDASFFRRDSPTLYIGLHDEILETIHKIIKEVRYERPRFHQVCSGYLISIMGQALSIIRNKEFKDKGVEKKINEAQVLFRDNVNKNMNMEDVAKDLNMGYSLFRKMFKKFTGVAPSQYHLMLRLQRAKDLLMSTGMSVGEIANELGFDSIYYFTRIFTKKMGYSPTKLRQHRHADFINTQ